MLTMLNKTKKQRKNKTKNKQKTFFIFILHSLSLGNLSIIYIDNTLL